MSDADIREYAQQENDYLLSLLLRPRQPPAVEDPQKLAERNCRATAKSFGESDPLHAMALNTLAFVHVYRGDDFDTAQGSAVKAAEILRGRDGHEEMLLESKCLIVLARTKAGSASSSAIQAVFGLPGEHPGPLTPVQDASHSLGEILAAAVFKRRINRVVLQMALRQIAETLLKELTARHETAGYEFLESRLLEFLDMYYGSRGDKNGE
jgi:hypothetical protein